MKKTPLTLILILLCLTSCTKNKAGDEFKKLSSQEQIIGNWKGIVQSALATATSPSFDTLVNETQSIDYLNMQFDRDGICRIDSLGNKIEVWTWEIVNDNMLVWNNIDTLEIQNLSTTKLRLYRHQIDSTFSPFIVESHLDIQLQRWF